ncbi:MAG TPA: hypothetical protein VF622_06650 [Segetibacter sp.]
MEALIFIFFLALFIYAVISIPFFKNSGLSRLQIASVFIIKILAGIAYGWFYKLPKYYAGADTWRFYRLSLEEKKWLLNDPAAFIKDLFVHGYNKTGNLFAGENSYWNDLKSNVPVKMMACMNVVTNNSYYTNIILFNFLFLFGLVAVFKMFNHIYPEKKWLIFIGIFLLPSTLFWCSGIHKDGLILSAIGLLTYNFYKLLQKEGKPLSRIIVIIVCIIFIFPLRNYVTLALLPALLCWSIAYKFERSSLVIFTSIYAIGIVLFFASTHIHPSLNFPQFIVEKQSEFRRLEGSSEINLQPLKPTFISFVEYFPSAIDMALFRPHINEIKNFSYIPAICEIILLVFLLILFLFFRNRNRIDNKKSNFFCIFFGLSLLIIAGYTITFSGAIVRYRSLALPLIITPLLCNIDWQKLLNRVMPIKGLRRNDDAQRT